MQQTQGAKVPYEDVDCVLDYNVRGIVDLIVDELDDSVREEPKSEVYPWDNHAKISRCLNEFVVQINSHLEYGGTKICYIMQNHHCAANW